MHSRSQRHAQAVYRQIAPLANAEEALRKQYGALCHRFPILVLRCGLAQALGFLQAKAKPDEQGELPAHGLLLGHLAEQLHGQANGTAFQQQVNQAPLAEYRRLTREALAMAPWYKRYAESLLGVAAGDEGDES